MAHKLVEDSEKSFKIQRPDGQVVHIAKTPETMPIYKLCKGGAMPGYAQGGSFVPGKAQVAGDSPKNDTVNAKLSPGELVVPRTIVAQGPQAVAKFAAEAMAGKHPASPAQKLNKGGEESDDDSSDKKDDTPSKEDVSDALKTIATAAAGGKDDSKSSLPKFGLGADPEPSAGDPHDSALYKSDAPLAKLMTGRIDITGKPTGMGDSNGALQVDGAPLQNAQTDYDQAGYSPTPSTDSSATAGPDTGGGQPATQDPSQAPGYNPMAGVPNAAPQQAQPGAPAPLEAAQNQAPAVDPNAPATNVGAPDGTGHVPPTSTGGGAASGGMKPVGETRTSTYNPYLAKSVKDVQAAGDNLVAADTAAATEKNRVDQLRLAAEYTTLKAQNEKIATFEAKRNNEIESRIAKMDAVQTKFAGMSIDSNRLYGDGQTGNKILAGIGLSLGAFGQGLAGGPNQALQAIDKAIDRDIEVQKANINKVGKEYEMARGGLKDYMDASKDMETSMVAEKARQLELVGKEYEKVAAANANPMIKAQAAKTAYEVSQKVAALNEKVGSNTKALVYSSAPLHQETQLPEEQKEVREGIQTQVALEGLKNLVDSGEVETGKLKGNWMKVMKKMGIQSASEEDAMNKAKQIAVGLAHQMGGARGVTPAEFQNLKDLAPNLTDKPEAFLKEVNNVYEKVVANNNMIAKGNSDNRRIPYDLDGLKRAALSGMPEHYKSVIGFKPNAGQQRKVK